MSELSAEGLQTHESSRIFRLIMKWDLVGKTGLAKGQPEFLLVATLF